MVAKDVEQEIKNKSYREGFCYPYYEKYCFSNIPSTILSIFGIRSKRPTLPKKIWKPQVEKGEFDKVVLLLLDALSFYYWVKNLGSLDLFNSVAKEGIVSPITSVFPSTTASALTTLATGLPPAEHGLLEWNLYLEEIDMAIATLPFSPLGEGGPDKPKEINADPKILFDGRTIFQGLKEEGISSFSFLHKNYVDSCYSKEAYGDSERVSYFNSSDLSVRLKKRVERVEGPAYFFVYWGLTDSMEHKYGCYTEEQFAECLSFQFVFLREFTKKMNKKEAKNTLLVVTSDHGQVSRPKEVIHLSKFRKIEQNIRQDKRGVKLVTGSPRDTFIHVKENKLDQIKGSLSKIKDIKLMERDELIKENLLGGILKKKFRERLGDLVILPSEKVWVWYKHTDNGKIELLGHHGGLTKKEMIIPFGIVPCSKLV